MADVVHAIGGLPRSGSTLLTNILNQNPRFHASSTSSLPGVLQAVSIQSSNAPETKSDLAHDREATEDYIRRTNQAIVRERYAKAMPFVENLEAQPASVAFDKSRFWGAVRGLFREASPGGRLIVCVRDIRAVVGSLERQAAKFPELSITPNLAAAGVLERVNFYCSPEGMVGGPMTGIVDMILLKDPDVFWLPFEALTQDPEGVMTALYAMIDEEPFEHQFDDVVNVSTDLDALYLNHFPHEGCGKVQKPPMTWQKWLPEELADGVLNKWPAFAEAFGYEKQKTQVGQLGDFPHSKA